MKALSLLQPWADTILFLDKRIDIRDADDWMARAKGRRGGFAGVMEIKDSLQGPEGLGRWAFGPHCYVLDPKVTLFRELIPAKGQLGFWNVHEELFETVQHELRWCWNKDEKS